jgi:hypothetical protein
MLDDIDHALLQVLQRDGQVSYGRAFAFNPLELPVSLSRMRAFLEAPECRPRTHSIIALPSAKTREIDTSVIGSS